MSDDKKPGPTGRFPNGMAAPDDKGELRTAISVKGGNIVLEFGYAVDWLALPPDQALILAAEIFKKAASAKGEPVDVVVYTKDDVAPELTIKILQGYLRALFNQTLPSGGTMADFLEKEDHKLHFAIRSAMGP
jgi:hypothetical protein